MVAFRGKCSTLFIYLLCCLTFILGTNQQVMCHEDKIAHLQLIECSSSQASPLTSIQQSKIRSISGINDGCPGCFDIHISFLLKRENNSLSNLIFDGGQALFSGKQYYSEHFNLVEVQQEHLALILPREAEILSCIQSTVLLI